MTPYEFLKNYCGIESESDCINYKPYEYSTIVNTLSVKEAITKINRDIKEMIDFFKAFNLSPEMAIEATYNIWKKHLIVFK